MSKVVCGFSIRVVVLFTFITARAELGRNDHWEGAPHLSSITMSLLCTYSTADIATLKLMRHRKIWIFLKDVIAFSLKIISYDVES